MSLNNKEDLIIRIEARYEKLKPSEFKIIDNSLKTNSPESIAIAIDNYYIGTKRFDIDFLFKKENFDKYKSMTHNSKMPEYLDILDSEAKSNLIDCHNEIMFKCCAFLNKFYEPLVKQLFYYFTEDKIPFWCMSGVLYHDIFKHTPVKPYEILGALGKRLEFIELCRKQYKAVQDFKNNHPGMIKDILLNKRILT